MLEFLGAPAKFGVRVVPSFQDALAGLLAATAAKQTGRRLGGFRHPTRLEWLLPTQKAER